MTDGKPAFAEEFERIYKEREGALNRVEILEAQKNEHADRARLNAAEVDRLREKLDEETAAHAQTRSKVGSLQERASQLPELERKLASAESDLGDAKSEVEKLREEAASLKKQAFENEDRAKVAEAARDKSEAELAKLNDLSKALADYRSAKDALASLDI